jgi:uncharacterized membrane protein YcgQ (UPF0703/DUF1980 family)
MNENSERSFMPVSIRTEVCTVLAVNSKRYSQAQKEQSRRLIEFYKSESADIRITSRFLSVISEFSIGFDSFLDLRLSDFTGFLFHDVDGGVN